MRLRCAVARRTLLLLAASLSILAFHAVTNYYVIKTDRYMINFDMAVYFSFINGMISKLSLPFPADLSVFSYIIMDSWKPPLFHIAALPFVWLKNDIQFACMVNILFLGVTMAAIYLTGRLLFNGAVGALAALIYTFLPSVFALSRVFYIETALTAVTSLTFYLFVLNWFHERRYAVFTGLVMAAGFLTKETYLVFVIPAMFYFSCSRETCGARLP